jgi:hypothetical protein
MEIEKSFCLFLDVLGFNELTTEAFKENRGQELLESFHNAIFKGVGELREKSSEDGYRSFSIKTFTDNIVLSTPITSWHAEDNLADLIFDVCRFNTHMAISGFFIRGGWTVNEHYMDDEMVFGPAILEAYGIESKVAQTPRIALDPKVTTILKGHLDFYANREHAPQNSHFLVDADGVAFVNYLSSVVDDYDYPHTANGELLEKHKNRIIENLEKYRGVTKIWAKYQWVASYHNYFLGMIKDDCRDQDLSIYEIEKELFDAKPMTLAQKYPKRTDANKAG